MLENFFHKHTANQNTANWTDIVRRDNITIEDEGGIYIIMSAKRISVRLNDDTEEKVEEMRKEMEEKFKIQISVTDVIHRSIMGMYEEMELEKIANKRNKD